MPRIASVLPLGIIAALILPSNICSASLTRLTASRADDLHPTWTADGQFLIYHSGRNGTDHLFKVPATGGAEVQLTFGDMADRFPTVSPDGAKIAFVRMDRSRNHPNPAGAVWTVPVDGGPMTEVTPFSWNILEKTPVWSPDATTLYFPHRDAAGTFDWDLFQAPASGGPATVYFATRSHETDPVPNPDGVSLTFSTSSFNHYLNITRSPLTAPNQLTRLTDFIGNTAATDYSDDGTKLLYVTRTRGALNLWEWDLVTDVRTQLTFDPVDVGLDPGTHHATYSPDGTRIAFSSRRLAGNYNVWVLDRSPGEGHVRAECAMQPDRNPAPGGTFQAEFTICADGGATSSYAWCLSDDRGWQLPACGTESVPDGQCRTVRFKYEVPDDAAPGSTNNMKFSVHAVAYPAVKDSCELLVTVADTPPPQAGLSSDFALDPGPNPFKESAALAVSVGTPSLVTVKIYDAVGRLVRSFEQQYFDAGRHEISWNGRNDSSEKAPDGIYFVVAQANGRAVRTRLVLVR